MSRGQLRDSETLLRSAWRFVVGDEALPNSAPLSDSSLSFSVNLNATVKSIFDAYLVLYDDDSDRRFVSETKCSRIPYHSILGDCSP
jgi:hypothetical protein